MELNKLSVVALLSSEEIGENLQMQMSNIGIVAFSYTCDSSDLIDLILKQTPHILIIDEACIGQDLVKILRGVNSNIHALFMVNHGKNMFMAQIEEMFSSVDTFSKKMDQFELYQRMKKKHLLVKKRTYSLEKVPVNELVVEAKVDCELRGISETLLIMDTPVKFRQQNHYSFDGNWLLENLYPCEMMVTEVRNNFKGYGFLTFLYLRNQGEEFLMETRRRRAV